MGVGVGGGVVVVWRVCLLMGKVHCLFCFVYFSSNNYAKINKHKFIYFIYFIYFFFKNTVNLYVCQSVSIKNWI